MVRSNNDYSAKDMEKTIPLVLWIQVLNYFPAIMNKLCKVFEDYPQFRPIEIIDCWITNVSQKVNPLINIEFDYTNESFYRIRRHIMNVLSEPENCIKVYEASLQVFKNYEAAHLCENIKIAIAYYKSLANGLESFSKDQDTIDSIKVKWIKAVTPVVHGEG